ncbi:MAG: RQC-minor-1 family DNA-binding protein [Clostridia bacterium]|nr:RQC-minor-1 family DNA-binding protein [Clostridia bacterium]
MSGRKERVQYHLDPRDVKDLPECEIAAILRGADNLIMRGGRTMLAKVLKGSRDRKVVELGFDQSPVYGYYSSLSQADVLARIDWVICSGYLDIEYDGRLPMLVLTDDGWAIERETYAHELLRGLDRLLVKGPPYDMGYLKDRNRELIWRLLDLIEESGNPGYIPLLEAWAEVDYQKVRKRINAAIRNLDMQR